MAELIELTDEFGEFFLRPLLDVAKIEERFLYDRSFMPCRFNKFEVFVMFVAA